MEFTNRLVTLNDLKQYNTNIKHSIDNYVQINVTAINKTITDNTNELHKQINVGGTGLTNEVSERKVADQNLQKQITENKTTIGNEIVNRNQQVEQSLMESKLYTDTKLGNLSITVDGVATTYTTVTQALQRVIGMHDSEIQDMLSEHNRLSNDISQEETRAKQREDSIESTLDYKIQVVQNTADTALTVVNNHTANSNNPHGVTTEQIGAVKQEAFTESVSRITKLESELSSTKENLVETELDVANLFDSVGELQKGTLKNSGPQVINGSLQTTGDVTVGGDLTVKGTTKSVHQETITVSDNLLVLNDAKEDVSALLSGVVINTGSSSYGIVYDGTTQSVKLGSGVVDTNGDYKFIGTGNPILTRAEHNTFTDGHVVVWDEANKRVIDGGVVPTLTGLGAASQLDLESLTSTVDNQGQLIEQLNSDYTTHKSDSISRLSNLESGKQSVTDDRLKTVDKTIYGAINEVHDEFDNHLVDSNPHNVTYEQVGAEPSFEKNTAFNKNFSDVVPMENGVASAGDAETVSRSDHVHPTDISRAPVDHSSVDESYGKASDVKYGHVKVDTSLNLGSTNPVSSNVIQSEFTNVRTEIESKVDVLTKSVAEEQSRAVEKETELGVSITALTNQVNDNYQTLTDEDTTIHNRISEEENKRIERDTSLQESLDRAVTELTTNYDPVKLLYDSLNGVDINQIYVVAFDTTDPDNPKPYFKPLVIDNGTLSG